MVLKRTLKVSDDVYHVIEKLKHEMNLRSPNQVLRIILEEYQAKHVKGNPRDIDQGNPDKCDPMETLRDLLKTCRAERLNNIYVIRCGSKTAVIGEKTLIDLLNKFNIMIEMT
jgi:hypothetical protein